VAVHGIADAQLARAGDLDRPRRFVALDRAARRTVVTETRRARLDSRIDGSRSPTFSAPFSTARATSSASCS